MSLKECFWSPALFYRFNQSNKDSYIIERSFWASPLFFPIYFPKSLKDLENTVPSLWKSNDKQGGLLIFQFSIDTNSKPW